eukprot:5648045-Amphidinium_carterae.1
MSTSMPFKLSSPGSGIVSRNSYNCHTFPHTHPHCGTICVHPSQAVALVAQSFKPPAELCTPQTHQALQVL